MRALKIENETTGETFQTKSLARAQQYRDAHEGDSVAIWAGEVLIGESSARFFEKERKAANAPLLSRAILSGVPVIKVGSVFPAGTTVEDINSGRAKAESDTWTSDGRMIARHAWCAGACGQKFDNAIYFHDSVTGSHGWACGRCRKVTQTS